MLNEFKAFAMKGNVMDMAIGIVLGAAFTTIVKAIVDYLLMPPLGLATGNLDFSNQFVVLKNGAVAGPYTSLQKASEAGAVVIGYGMVINALISFVIVAFALFFVVRWVNRLKAPEPAPAAPTTKPCEFCKQPIHLQATRCQHCTSQVGGRAA